MRYIGLGTIIEDRSGYAAERIPGIAVQTA